MQLLDRQRRRLYFGDGERKALLAAAMKSLRKVRPFWRALHYTGYRISEAMALIPKAIDLSGEGTVFENLKSAGVASIARSRLRLLGALDMVHGVRELQGEGSIRSDERLWTRMTPYRRVHKLSSRPTSGRELMPARSCSTVWPCSRQRGHRPRMV